MCNAEYLYVFVLHWPILRLVVLYACTAASDTTTPLPGVPCRNALFAAAVLARRPSLPLQ
jgi:hypothetical protein